MIVTTGGQQVIDLVCKTLIDPGDVIVAEAPTYPGAVPTFSAYQADVVQIDDGRGRDADRRARGHARPARIRGPAAEVHLHDPQLPEPGRGDDVAGPPAAAGRGGARARAAGARGQPLRAAALRGRAAADALLAGRRSRPGGRGLRPRDLPGHLLEDPLARPAARLGGGAEARAGEAQPRQTGRRPVLLAGHADVRRGLLRRAGPRRAPAWEEYVESPAGALPAAAT